MVSREALELTALWTVRGAIASCSKAVRWGLRVALRFVAEEPCLLWEQQPKVGSECRAVEVGMLSPCLSWEGRCGSNVCVQMCLPTCLQEQECLSTAVQQASSDGRLPSPAQCLGVATDGSYL